MDEGDPVEGCLRLIMMGMGMIVLILALLGAGA